MSEKLYNSMLEKWITFLEDNWYYVGDAVDSDEASDMYVGLKEDFEALYKYKEEIIEMAFHEKWYDTFANEFYAKLEKEGIEILIDGERSK